MITNEIVSAVPANTNTIPFLPICDAIAYRIDTSGDFMTGHSRILESGPKAFFDQNVTVANAAGINFYSHLSGTWLRNRAFYYFKITASFANLGCFHFVLMQTSYAINSLYELALWGWSIFALLQSLLDSTIGNQPQERDENI